MDSNKIRTSLQRVFRVVKPWLFYVALFLVLRYTGLIGAVSSVTQQALMKTGAMDASPERDAAEKKFNYDFALQDLNRNTLQVESLKGKTLFINVWATWCGPCRVEMPSIQSLYNQVDHSKVEFIMLAVDHKDPHRKVEAYIRDQGYTFPVYLPSGSLPAQLQVSSIPATFVVDKEGKIVFRESGAANYGTEEFRNFLMGL
jgi:thiol-disulfide isomerase/thioredoxin